MITRSVLLIGLIGASAFAFSPLAEGQHRHGGGGGTHFRGNHSSSFNRGTSFNRGAGFHRGSGFNRGGSFSRGGHFHHGHFRHHRNSFVFIDPFYYAYSYGYPYGYGYPTYYAQPYYYDDGVYTGEGYSAEMNVQSALADLGYYDGPIDGLIGTGTRRAVRAFQRDNGLPSRGASIGVC